MKNIKEYLDALQTKKQNIKEAQAFVDKKRQEQD
jgi:hypothetical protein